MSRYRTGEALVFSVATVLISADEHDEHDFNVLYDQAGGRRVEHWNLPDAHHTAAIRDSAEEYERRVVAFFDGSLDRN
jgi:hypothetical protein